MYAHEKQIRVDELAGEDKRAYRQTHTRAVVETFWRWCRAQCHRPELLPKSPLAKALRYAQQRRSGLEVFLDDPEVAIDTNHLERALRPIPLGKRNWLFTSSEVGAQRVGIIRSLLVTCRLHEVDVYTCLVDVLPAHQRTSGQPRHRTDPANVEVAVRRCPPSLRPRGAPPRSAITLNAAPQPRLGMPAYFGPAVLLRHAYRAAELPRVQVVGQFKLQPIVSIGCKFRMCPTIRGIGHPALQIDGQGRRMRLPYGLADPLHSEHCVPPGGLIVCVNVVGWPRAVASPRLPQIRTCPIRASGSSDDGFAASSHPAPLSCGVTLR